jgi:hypothetical protein
VALMARKKNATFQGVSPFDVDVDALTKRSVLESICGDLALISDKATGQNAEASTCNHGGTAGRGSLLGVPLVNQYVGRTLFVDYSAGGAVSDKDGGTGPTLVWVAPIFIAPGETQIVVDVGVQGQRIPPMVAYVRSTAFAVVGADRVLLEQVGDGLLRARITGLTSGLRILCVEANTDGWASNGDFGGVVFDFQSISVHVDRDRRRGVPPHAAPLSTSPFGVTAPGATEGFVDPAFDAALFGEGLPVHGYLTAGLNRWINGLYEYVTGYRAGGNATRTLVDHDGAGAFDDVDPARSRALAHTRSLYAAEPEVAWPLWSEGFGAFKLDGGLVVNATTSPTYGMLEWFAPWPNTASAQAIRQLRMQMPDFQTSSSRLKWAVLCGVDSGTVSNWSARVSAGGATSVVAFTAIAGTKLALATGTALAFTADSLVDVVVGTVKSGALGAADECVPLGACLYFEP